MPFNLKDKINKPRTLYGALFAWLALSGGRFTAPFLKEEANFSDTDIGIALAIQTIVYSICSYVIGGRIADYYEERYKNNIGRIIVFRAGIYISSIAFLLHGMISNDNKHRVLYHTCLRIVYAIGMSLCMPVLDGLTISYLKWNSGSDPKDYGKERLYGAIWWAVANLIIGPCVDVLGFKVFYVSCILSATACIIATYLFTYFSDYDSSNEEERVRLKQQQQHGMLTVNEHTSIISQILLPCACTYGIIYLFCYFVIGMGTSVVESLIFLFFEFLGSSNSLCGLTVVITVVFEIPIFQLAPKLLDKLGHDVLLLIACIAYIIRVLGYSFIPQGHLRYLVLFLEPLHGVTYAAYKLSGVQFISLITPEGLEASGQGILNLFLGLGSFSGLILGGYLEEVFDPRFMYRAFAFIVFVGTFIFATFCVLRDRYSFFIPKKLEKAPCLIIDESTELMREDKSRRYTNQPH